MVGRAVGFSVKQRGTYCSVPCTLVTAWGYKCIPRICGAQGAKLPGARVLSALCTPSVVWCWHPKTPPLQGTEHTSFWATTRSEGGFVKGCGHWGIQGCHTVAIHRGSTW